MQEHRDLLEALNRNAPLGEKLDAIFDVVAVRYPYLDHIAVAVYDPEAEHLKTFAQGPREREVALRYDTELGPIKELLQQQSPRLLDDLEAFAAQGHPDTARVAKLGILASYTMPMFLDGTLFGFIFFNAKQKRCFRPASLETLDVFGHLISLMVINELASIRTLLATVQAARDEGDDGSVETGAHVGRTAHYARLIATELRDDYGFDDDYIEHVFLFSPLHDIGKIGIPDNVLMKPGKLSEREFQTMKTHVGTGREIIDAVLDAFGLSGVEHIDVLRNIARFHHEAIDGSGYPDGLKGDEIPIEARIMSVADVFDALTSSRPYKEAWGNPQAIDMLRKLAGMKLDGDCVEALARNLDKIDDIQSRLGAERFG